jgi:cell division septum initiation protein DivIVA
VDKVRDTRFPVAFRGYERGAVDRYVAKMAELVAELEATQLRETVVERALEEVGEQTSGILQQARDSADEITSKSRSQAEGRMQRAEREAANVRREADEYAQRVEAEVNGLRRDRLALIEEMRRLADEVLAVADDALERLPEEEQEEETQEVAASEPSDGGPPPADESA